MPHTPGIPHLHPIVKCFVIRMSLLGVENLLIATYLNISEQTARAAKARYRTTCTVTSSPRKVTGRRPLLGDIEMEYVDGLLPQCRDLYITKIQRYLHENGMADVSPSTLWKSLARRGYTKKKISKRLIERDEDRRAKYCVRVGSNYTWDQLVFVDESACDGWPANRTHGWGLSRQHVTQKDQSKGGRKYLVLPALSLDGILNISIVEGAYNAELFGDFIKNLVEVMNPYPLPNSVLVMDNCQIHHSECVADLCQSRGIHLVYLPPYSLDFNPIEQAFSAVKAWIKRNRDYMQDTLDSPDPQVGAQAFVAAVMDAVTPAKADGWFCHCGY